MLSKNLNKALESHSESVKFFQEAIHLLESYLPSLEASQSQGRVYNSELSDLWTPRFLFHQATHWEKKNLKNFKVVPFNEIAKIERGKGTRVSQYTATGVPFIRTSSLVNNGLDYFPDHFTNESTYSGFKQPIEDKDIIVSMEGKIGAVALLSSKWPIVFKNHIERARLYKEAEVEPEFVFALLNTRQYKAMIDRRVVVQATIPGMSNRLRSLPMIISSKQDQKDFLDIRKKVRGLVQEGHTERTKAYSLLRKSREAF